MLATCSTSPAVGNNTKDRTDNPDGGNHADHGTNDDAGVRRRTTSGLGALATTLCSCILNAWGENTDGSGGLGPDLTIANDHHGTIARDSVDDYEHEARTGSEEVCVGGNLGDVQEI